MTMEASEVKMTDKLGSVFLKIYELLIRLMGPKKGGAISAKIGQFIASLTPREQKIVQAQLKVAARVAPRLNGLDAKELLRKNYQHLAESISELQHLNYLLEIDETKELIEKNSSYPNFKHIEAEGIEECRSFASTKEGALFLAAHLGNFELLAAYHIKCGLPVTILGKEPNYNFLSNWIQNIRDSYGANSLLRGNAAGSKRGPAVASITALKENKVLALLPDQDTALASEFAPFFGIEAAYVITPVKMAIKNKKRIFSSFIVRTGRLKHRAISAEIFYDPDYPDAEKKIIAEYSARLQTQVEAYPEQYLWFHRRWRRRPGVDYQAHPELLRGTNEYLKWIYEDNVK